MKDGDSDADGGKIPLEKLFCADHRFTAIGDKKRFDVAVEQLGTNLGSGAPIETVCELMIDGKVWNAGVDEPFKVFTSLPQSRPAPLSMCMLTVDTQANGNGATHEELLRCFEMLQFVDSFPSNRKEVDCGTWIYKNRKMLLEVEFQKGLEMPVGFNYYFSISMPLPEGEEFSGKYREKLKKVSSARVKWKKLGNLFVPERIEMSRGWKGGNYINQIWEFTDWRLGANVDEKRLDKELFVKGPGAFEILAELRADLVRAGLR